MKMYSKLLNHIALMCVSVLMFSSTSASASVNPLEVPTSNEEVTLSDLLVAPPSSLHIVSLTPFMYNGNVSIRCNGTNTGRLTVVAGGGLAPYTYTWSAGIPIAGGTMCVGLFAGSCTVTVTDALGFSVSQSIILTENPPLQAIATVTPILCNGGVATVTISATGGTPQYAGLNWYDVVPPGPYSYTVADANGCRDEVTIVVSEPPVFEASATSSTILCNGDLAAVTVEGFGGTPSYNGVGLYYESAGQSSYTITDANGCFAYASVMINQPPVLAANVSSTSIACRGGDSQVTVTGLGGVTPYMGTGVFTSSGGNYSFTVTDANGCQSSSSITIIQPTALVATVYNSPIACNGDLSAVEIIGTGGTPPYTGPGIYFEPAGWHEFTISDVNGCSVDIATIIVEPSPIQLDVSWVPIMSPGPSATTNVEVLASGGTPIYSGTGTFLVTAGNYFYTVTDANGCVASEAITITGANQNNFVLDGNGNNYGSLKTNDLSQESLSSVQGAFNVSSEQMEVSFQLKYDSKVEVEVYDMTGALIETIEEEMAYEDQNYTLSIDSDRLTNGVYIYHLVTDLERRSDKLQVIR